MDWTLIDGPGGRLGELLAHNWELLGMVEELLAEGDWEGVQDAVDELVGCESRIDDELILLDPAFRPWLKI